MAPDVLIVAAAGHSARFGRDKLLLRVGGLPLVAHALLRLSPLFPDPSRRLLVVSPERVGEFRRLLGRLPSDCAATVVAGGATRFDSVAAALALVPDDAPLTAIHDAARPLVTAEAADACLAAARRHGAALLAHRASDTIKVCGAPSDDGTPTVASTPDRAALWAAETPQVARTDWLREAFAECRRRGVTPTDDAQALELCGHRPVLVENRASNLKVTRPEDLALVRAILAARRRDRLSPLPSSPNLPR